VENVGHDGTNLSFQKGGKPKIGGLKLQKARTYLQNNQSKKG
jgi:hypothetical protein